MTAPDKPSLRAELLVRLRADLEAAERAHRTTMEGATHAEAKPESDKDTRALEQQYLARGQAARVEALRTAIALVASTSDGPLRRVALGAVVTVEDESGVEEVLFIAPAGGGAKLADGRVRVVTLDAPLARALIGKASGDEVELTIAGRARALTVVEVG